MRFFVKAAFIGSLAVAIQGGAGAARADGGLGQDPGGGDACSPYRVVHDWMESFSTLDAQLVSSYLADDLYYTNTGLSPISGEAETETYLAELLPLFSYIQFEVLAEFVQGDEVLVRRVENYTISPDSPVGYPGADYANPVMGHYVVKDCKITQWDDYWDTASFGRATGIPLPNAE